MKSLNERGAINVLMVPLILVIVFFLVAAGFGYWAFASREDYKNNSDAKVATAVPNVSDQDQSFSLRIQLVSQSYDQVLNSFSSSAKNGKVAISPYSLPKVPNVVGSKVQGQLTQNKQGTMVILPLRNMTLKIWVDASQFAPDYNNIILPNRSYTP